MIKKLFISLCLFLSISSSFALQKIFIFHINGVNTNQQEANDNVTALQNTIGAQSNMIANNGQVDLLYNKKDGASLCTLCTQLSDVFGQKKYENITVDDYVKAYMAAKKLNYKPGTPEYIALKNSIKAKYYADPTFMGNNFTDILNQFRTRVGTTAYLTEYLKAASSNGSKPFVLLIPHSQGNLYANNLYKKLTTDEGYNQRNLSIYGIASPAASNLGDYISKTSYNNSGYITSSNDGVINGLRVFAALPPQQAVAAANITVPVNASEITGHKLIGTYLANPAARQQIATNTYNILHYFWLSNIYSNFEQTKTGGARILSPEITFVATQAGSSGLSINGLMANGNCPNLPYFVAKNSTYDPEIGVGRQCVGTTGGTYQFGARDYDNNNTIRIKINRGSITQMLLTCRRIQDNWFGYSSEWQTISSSYWGSAIGGYNSDQGCSKDRPGFPIAGGYNRSDVFRGVVGELRI
ncbi:MAG: hypothetical protein E6Q32_01765 [Neisseriales bacterium]|jgi:hypothetical protein|nr:MAG: hypothetical protein E6Q32_01765 [Neisseriales bacterium]